MDVKITVCTHTLQELFERVTLRLYQIPLSSEQRNPVLEAVADVQFYLTEQLKTAKKKQNITTVIEDKNE